MYEQKLCLFSPHGKQTEDDTLEFRNIQDPALEQKIGERPARELRDNLETIHTVYPAFDLPTYLQGDLSPVFFGSAVNNFGVKELLDCFIQIAPYPQARDTEERTVDPAEEKFTGFVFKIHANIDPKHRDRIAFVRICSGLFQRNTPYYHVRSSKSLLFSNPTSFMAAKKSSY